MNCFAVCVLTTNCEWSCSLTDNTSMFAVTVCVHDSPYTLISKHTQNVIFLSFLLLWLCIYVIRKITNLHILIFKRIVFSLQTTDLRLFISIYVLPFTLMLLNSPSHCAVILRGRIHHICYGADGNSVNGEKVRNIKYQITEIKKSGMAVRVEQLENTFRVEQKLLPLHSPHVHYLGLLNILIKCYKPTRYHIEGDNPDKNIVIFRITHVEEDHVC